LLSRDNEGPDSDFSLEPDEFADMVQAVRKTETALGGVRYETGEKESESKSFRRSLFAVKEIEQGDAFTDKNVRSIRPGCGLHPRYLPEIIGREAARNIDRGTPLGWPLIS
jgi:sialic acid synthase SpsE